MTLTLRRSGLDSATAKALVERLKQAAHDEQRTVIATIHQPSWEVLTKFDSVVLVAGGMVVYDAAPDTIPVYFARGGSPVPDGENPADHLMYTLHEGGTAKGGEKWAAIWADSPERQQKEFKSEDLLYDSDEKVPGGFAISYWDQYRVLLQRTIHIFVTDRQQGPLIWKMMIGMNVVVVLLLAGMAKNLSKGNAVFFYVIAEYAQGMTPLVVIMPQEKAIIRREYRNGVFSAPIYWLARVTLAILHSATLAVVSTLFVYPLCGFPVTPFPSKLLRWFSFQFLYMACVTTLGLTIGVNSPSPLVGIKMVVSFEIPWIVTAGFLPPLNMLRPAVFYLRYPNLYTWAGKLATTIAFTHDGEKATSVLRDDYQMHLGNANSCFWALGICYGVIFVLGTLSTIRALTRADESAGARPAAQAGPTSSRKNGVASSKSLSSVSSYGAIEDVEAAPTTRMCDIEVRGVSYRHKANPDKLAANDVSVKFESGKAALLMGPSGAGKTTLLNLLSGRLPDATYETRDGNIRPCLEGFVLVDGKPASLATFRAIGTVTPQDEILPPVLTVRQTLLYTAKLRGTPNREERVEAIMAELGLTKRADNVVGDAQHVGISGGQKKRLSIGIDLLAELPVMLVDEPTTGLDASAALDVVQNLIRLAAVHHRTVICTMHQPPWTTVTKFNQLVVMARGCLVYDGPPRGLVAFLAQGGAPVPTNENPADHVMTVLVQDHEPWVAKKGKADNYVNDYLPPHEVTETYPISLYDQYCILVHRCGYIFMVDEDQFPELLFPSIIIATTVGLAFRNFGVNIYLAQALLMATASHGMLVLNSVILNIPAERELVLREYRNGTFAIEAYWLARTTISILLSIGAGLVSFPIWYPLVALTGRFGAVIHVFMATTLNSCIFGAFAGLIGLICKTQLATAQIGEPFGNSMIVFSGVLIIKRFIKPYALPFYYALPISYAFEIEVTSALEHKGEDGDDVMSYYGLHAGNRRMNYAVLASMLVFWIGVGYAVARSTIGAIDGR